MARASNNRNGANGSIKINEICMLCGKSKEEKKLVCYGCYKEYKQARIESVAIHLKDISIVEWTLKKAEDLSPILKEEFSQASADLDSFKKGIRDQAYQDVRKALGGKAIPKEDFSNMFEKRRQKLWQEGDGNRLFGQFKYLELRTIGLPLLIRELEEKVAAHDKQSSTSEAQDSEETSEETKK